MKIPLTLAGIEPATFRFVAQHLKHCATAVPVTHMEYTLSGAPVGQMAVAARGTFLTAGFQLALIYD